MGQSRWMATKMFADRAKYIFYFCTIFIVLLINFNTVFNRIWPHSDKWQTFNYQNDISMTEIKNGVWLRLTFTSLRPYWRTLYYLLCWINFLKSTGLELHIHIYMAGLTRNWPRVVHRFRTPCSISRPLYNFSRTLKVRTIFRSSLSIQVENDSEGFLRSTKVLCK